MLKKDDGTFSFKAAPEDFPQKHKAPVLNIGIAETGREHVCIISVDSGDSCCKMLSRMSVCVCVCVHGSDSSYFIQLERK